MNTSAYDYLLKQPRESLPKTIKDELGEYQDSLGRLTISEEKLFDLKDALWNYRELRSWFCKHYCDELVSCIDDGLWKYAMRHANYDTIPDKLWLNKA